MSQIPETANKGLENIVACTSEISTIHDTTLLYRGYTIENLASHCGFEEVVYLPGNATVPKPDQPAASKQELSKYMTMPPETMPMLDYVAKTNSHSMAKLR